MNDMRKLMEMVEAGEYGSVDVSSLEHDVEVDGIGVMFYDNQVAVYDESGQYQVFMPVKTWLAFVSASQKRYGEGNT
jgi:hypothetical protein